MITIQNLAFSYSKQPVLKNISLTLEEGKIYGLLGENGVGKTTLLSLLSGLIRPEEGTISVENRNPYKREPSFLNDVFFLSDEVLPQNCPATVWAQSTGVFWSGFDNAKFLQIAKEFDVDPTKKMTQMSAGQLKKIYIAFALSLNVKVLLMDEPTNALDIPSKSTFRSAILKYTREDSIVVVSTHQVRDLESVVDPIVILDSQSVLLNASIEEISKKLYFDYGNVLDSSALYFEQLPGGYVQVLENRTGEDSKVNIEALFNAAHKHKDIIRTMFE